MPYVNRAATNDWQSGGGFDVPNPKASHSAWSLPEADDMSQALKPTIIVEHLPPDPSVVDAELLDRPPNQLLAGDGRTLRQASATPPCEFCAHLPNTFQPGRPFTVIGPLGPVTVEPPEYALPGMSLRYRLAPRPAHRLHVPAGSSAGDELTFQRPEDGVEVSVFVPEGLFPGDTFDITPPALMVKVPTDTEGGDLVVFSGPPATDGHPQEWFWARVPQGMAPNQYMTARLPRPKKTFSHQQMPLWPPSRARAQSCWDPRTLEKLNAMPQD
jgi:hypothetical protein